MQQPSQNSSVYQSLLAQGFTPQQISALMQLGVLQEEGGIIGQEMELADQLRATPTPQGRYSGRTFVSSHPLEMVGTALNRGLGAYRQKQGMAQQRENARRKAELRAQFLRQMGGRGTPTPAQSAQTYAYGTNPAPNMLRNVGGY